MCRWLAYSGSPILLEELLYKPAHSLIDQSMHARLGATTTNGDGFGVGWYTSGDTPGVFRAVGPAWSDRNLRELAGHVTSPLFLAHIRASTGTAVQQTNCHPFRHGRWLWVHNGMIRDFMQVKRDLVLAVDPSLYPAIEGSADSEVMFFLALTFGLEHDPPTAVERMAGFVEAVAAKQGIKEPLQMTIGTSDGERVWHSATPVRAGHGRCSTAPRCTPCDSCTPTTPSCTRSPRRPASSSPNRSATSPAPGTRCRSPATGSSTKATTSSARSGPDRGPAADG
jgi:glutamine amidotransferase